MGKNPQMMTRWELKLEAFKKVGRGKIKSVCCGESDPRVLEINHLKGKPKKGERARRSFLRRVIEGRRPIDDLDLRCANCNILYEYERENRSIAEDTRAEFENEGCKFLLPCSSAAH